MLQVVNGGTSEVSSQVITELQNRIQALEEIQASPVSDGDLILNRVLNYAPNWVYVKHDISLDVMWRSRGAESGTGDLDIGYLKVGNKLIMSLAGGGGSAGYLKMLEVYERGTNQKLAEYTLGQLIGYNTDGLVTVTLDTSTYSGKVIWLRAKDVDSNNGWAWIGGDFARAQVVA